MARHGTYDRIVEAQYRNLAIATEIIAAKRRLATLSPLPKLDPEELVSTSGAVPQSGPLAALVESKAVVESLSKHKDHPPSGTAFQSWLAKVTTPTQFSLDTTSPSQTFGWQEQTGLLVRNPAPRYVPPSYLKTCSRTSLVEEEDALQNSKTEIVPTVKFPSDPWFIWKQKSCLLPPSYLEISSRTTVDEEYALFQSNEPEIEPIVKFPNDPCLIWNQKTCKIPPSYLGSSSRTSAEEENAALQDVKTKIVPIVKFPNDQCSVRPRRQASRSNRSPVPASRYCKPAFVLLDLCLEVTDSAYEQWSICIKTFDMASARVVALPHHTREERKRLRRIMRMTASRYGQN